MTASPQKSNAGFTLVEVLIGMSLSLMLMGAVLSSYVFLGRNFTRALGITSANQPTLEAQGRRALAYFTQDVRMASGLVATAPTPPNTFTNTVSLTLPGGDNSKNILYYYNSASSSRFLHAGGAIDSTDDGNSVEFPAGSLTRVTLSTPRISQILHRDLLSCSFSYYDTRGNPYTVFDPAATGFSSLTGIKQISMAFSSQGGNREHGTLTQVYRSASPRLILRNTPLRP